MSFQFDTTGRVQMAPDAPEDYHVWADLDCFTQGYIEALFASVGGFEAIRADDLAWPGKTSFLGFSDLAPETLARIIADCEAAMLDGYDNTIPAGSTFYAEREEGCEPAFPPLSVHLGDDGKVRFA